MATRAAPPDGFEEAEEPVEPLQEQFEAAARHMASSRADLTNAQKLRLYALFKQGCNLEPRPAAAPSMLNVKERAKWVAWGEVSGLSPEEAMTEYIGKVEAVAGPIGAASSEPASPSRRQAAVTRIRDTGREVREDFDVLIKVFAKSKVLAPHIPKIVKHKKVLRPYLPQFLPHIDLLAPLLPRMLDQLHIIGPYLGEIAEDLPTLLPYLSQLLDELPHIEAHVPALMEHRAAIFPALGGIAPHLPGMRPHIGALLARMEILGPYVPRISHHMSRLLPHTQPLLLQLDVLAPHLGELTAPEALEALTPHMNELVPHLAALAPHLPELVPRLHDLQPVLPQLIDSLPLLLPHLGPLLRRLDVLLPKLPELLANKELLLPNLGRLLPALNLASPASVNGLAAVATAATGAGSFFAALKKRIFKEDAPEAPPEPEPEADMEKVDGVVDATAARLKALEAALFSFKNDLQFRQQQQTEAAVRLAQLEGMVLDTEDALMAYEGSTRELDGELSRVERLLGPEAIKRGRDRRLVEARRTGNMQGTQGWDKWMSKLPL